MACAWIFESSNSAIRLLARVFGVGRAADDLDDLLDVLDGDDQALQDVGAVERLLQLEFGAADDDDLAVLDEWPRMSRIGSTRGRPSTSESRITPNVRLHLRVLVELVEDDVGVPSRFSSMTTRMPSRSDSSRMSADAVDLLVAHELGDALEERRLVDLVRDLGDDDRLWRAALDVLDLACAPHADVPRPVS